MSLKLTALRDTQDKAKLARAQFFRDQPVHPGLVTETVLRSWERSKLLSRTPRDRLISNHYISGAEAHRIREKRQDFLQACMPEMRHLSESLADSEWLILCSDAAGVIVDSLLLGTLTLSPWAKPLQTGRILREAEFGSNAPGCVLIEQRPVIFNQNEHFLDELSSYVCAAVPIFGARGALAGVLDITSTSKTIDSTILEMLTLAARRIENHLVADFVQHGRVISLHRDHRLIGSALEGVLCVSEGKVMAANRVAREILLIDRVPEGGLDAESVLPALGLSAENTKIRSNNPFQINDARGTRLYLQWSSQRSGSGRETHLGRNPSIQPAWTSQVTPRPCVGTMADEHVQEAYKKAAHAVQNDLCIVIEGETGVGKEVMAVSLHQLRRPSGPFVPVNCAAIREGLIESELFGYVDGAFTGARRGGAPGKIEQANGGTLFLDEIGEMPLTFQTRLLRVLEDRTVTPVGGAKLPVDITVICATHRDLESLVRAGLFRHDLYYRLCGLSVQIPPLRARSDIDQLIDSFLSSEQSKPLTRLAEEARAALRQYSWPGNVRQLRQVLHAGLALAADHGELSLQHLPDHITTSAVVGEPLTAKNGAGHLLEKMQTELISRALLSHDGNISAAARDLGVSRGTLYNYASRRSLILDRYRSRKKPR